MLRHVACALAFFRKMCKKCNDKKQIIEIDGEIKKEKYPYTDQYMYRPKIHYCRIVLCVISVLFVDIFITWFALWGASYFSWYDLIEISYGLQFFLLCIFLILISIIIFAKKIICFFIRLYQRYVPFDIRCNCLFVPNCSEYMILAIEKYGVYKGVRMGIDRLLRCHEPNGGEDYP